MALAEKNKKMYKISLLANLLAWIISSVFLNLVLEVLQRRSLYEALVHMVKSAPIFLLNTAIIMLCSSFMLIVRRKIFAFALPAFLWLIVGITNTVLLSLRPLPISFSDFRLVGEALNMMKLYFNIYEILLIVFGILAAIFVLVWIFVKAPQFECGMKKSLSFFIPLFSLLLAMTVILGIFDFFPRKNETPNEFYERNGFVYNFFKSARATGLYTPEGYSDDALAAFIAELDGQKADVQDERPNVIVLQLESFFDMTWMHGVSLSEDPVPNFRKLKDEGASGYLYVPSYGGGTSNVEFEILTGMNLDHFTIGESPYYTLLDKNVLWDTMPFNMKRLGYTAHAIHNYNALFYERPVAYNNLGFDTFTPVEYMNGVSFNSQGWTRDDVMTDEVIKALDSTENTDFVFAVSVQAHGPYPSKVRADEFPDYIDVKADNLNDEALAGLTYYACTIKEMDNMLGELVSALENYKEKCVLVVYGDHLPAIDFSVNYISAPNAYTTEYAIWSNYDITAEDKHLETYQLMAHVQDVLDLEEGMLTKCHLNYADEEEYQEKLKLIEFSMTSSENDIREDKISYSTRPIKITSITENAGDIVVYGENFTQCSKIMVGEEIVDTVFKSSKCIVADTDSLDILKGIAVCQMSRDGSTVLETITE